MEFRYTFKLRGGNSSNRIMHNQLDSHDPGPDPIKFFDENENI